MISYSQALQQLQTQAKQINSPIITVQITDALHHVCAEKVLSALTVPSFNNSAMDGYAFSSQSVKQASADHPVLLSIVSTISAGENIAAITASHENIAYEIMTGAMLPNHCDTVLPIEEAELIGDSLSPQLVIREPMHAHRHVRKAGEDFQLNEMIIQRGERVNASHVMALAAVGVNQIKIFKPLTIAFISTGLEIIDDLTKPLKPGQIYNSNLPYLTALAKDFPLTILQFKIQRDELTEFHQVMTEVESKNPDIIISIGAVSKGKWDFIPQGLQERGAEIFFHRVKIKPGKPILFARLSHDRFFFGLPGNPMASAVGWRFFVIPFLRGWLKMTNELPTIACVKNTGEKKEGMTYFLKASININTQGIVETEILSGQESFKIKPLLTAQGWVCLADTISSYKTGQKVEFYDF